MKYIAKQVPPEDQYPCVDIRFEDSENDISVMPERIGYGGRRYDKYQTELFTKCLKFLDDYHGYVDDLREGTSCNWEGDSEGELASVLGRKFTAEEVNSIYEMLDGFGEARSYEEVLIVAELMSLVSGEKFVTKDIRGDAQRDFAQIVYREDWHDKNFTTYFEAEWFNIGDEYDVYPEDNEDDVSYVYVHEAWSEEKTIKEIRYDAAIGKNDKLVLLKFKGYVEVPEWEEVA